MGELGVLLVVVGVFLANLPALRKQWRTDRAGSIKTIWLFAVYLLYVALGLVVLLLIVPREGGQEDKALYLTGFIVGWVLYGALALTRVVPRYREPPAWLMRFGIADVLLLGLTIGCLTAHVWA
jgi:hypothetical protein